MTPAQAESTTADLAAEAQERAIEPTDDLHPCMITGDGVLALAALADELLRLKQDGDPLGARLYLLAKRALISVCVYDRRKVLGGAS